MVKLLCVIIFNKQYNITNAAYELSSYGFFQRSNIKEICTFACKEFAKRCIDNYQVLQYMNFNIYALTNNKYTITCVSDEEYPITAAKSFLNKVIDIINYDNVDNVDNKIEELLIECQDPMKADKLIAIKNELEETKEILMKTMEDLLNRGESLDNLIEKSNELSNNSKSFMKETKKMNSCCNII